MKDFTLSSEDVPSSGSRSTDGEIHDYYPLELPLELRLRESKEQLEYLLLASLILLYRSSNGSEDATFTWGYYEDSTPATQVSASLVNVINDSGIAVSEVLGKVKAFGSSTQDSLENTMRWEDRHMFFAASHSTGRAAPFDTLNYNIESRVINDRFCVRQPQSSSSTSQTHATVHIHTFLDILQSLLASPNQTVAQSIQVGPNELAQIWSWNAEVPPAIERCMHDIIAERIIEDPDRPAVISWDGELTYGELDAYSRLLAGKLQNLGVGIDSIVPLCFEKSMWTVVGVLAVMRAGATFCLTDPAQPEARLRTIAEEVQAKVVLTSRKQAELASKILPEGQVVVVDSDFCEISNGATQDELPEVPADAILYVIFTSGSTGRPKGISISHVNYTSGAIPRAEAVGYRSHSRVLDFASYAFDVSIDCMLCTLARGGCICVPSDEDRVNNLSGTITKLKVNMAHMTPSVARVLPLDVLNSLEVLGLGGESVSPSDASVWGQKTKVVIAYGPSETTVGCTINNSIPLGRTYTSIGKGVGGVCWIVDPEDHDILTPIDGVGELLMEGPIVGVGYINEPEKTDAVFIKDPKWLIAGDRDHPGRSGRLYKTGDLVKYDPDGSGCIVFVGRKDRQVKLRGQRVELAEIEHHLRKQLPADVSVAAEVITPKGKEPTLVAFVSEKSRQEQTSDEDDITCLSKDLKETLGGMENALSEHLPIYMVPTAYIPLKELPTLVSCKVDRKRLQQIGNSMTYQQLARFRATDTEKNKPKTAMEIRLHKLWIKLLGNDIEIGTNDNFFALGADSLRAMKLVAAARLDGISLTVAKIFANPTLSAMANTAVVADTVDREIEAFSLLENDWCAEDARKAVAKLCNLDEALIEDVLPPTPLQEALMALSAKISEAYVAQRVVELDDMPIADKLKDAFEAVGRDSAILRTRIVQVPGHGLMQVVVNGSLSWLHCNDLETYLSQDRTKSMQLGEPLARFATVNDEKSGKVHMVLSIHHAVYDGWSMPLIIERVNQAYRGMTMDKRTPFKTFINYLSATSRSDSAEYWTKQLAGASGPQFPAHPYGGYQIQTDSLLEQYVTFSKASTSSTTVATAIRGAWALVASTYLASNDIVFGETLTGRNAPVPGIEEIEGPLITTVPVRVRINKNMKVSDFLDSIHELTIQRIPHEHFGLQHIRRLTPDAREACELKTGLVLHPNAEEGDGSSTSSEYSPADGLVPAGDEEAAREALKFSSYALMLVCTLGTDGFLTMASFDSNCVDKITMQRVLDVFSRIVKQLCESPDSRIEELHFVSEDEVEELLRLNVSASTSLESVAKDADLEEEIGTFKSAWIVDPSDADKLLPYGAIGELLLRSPVESTYESIKTTSWLALESLVVEDQQPVLRTGKLARYRSDGTIELIDRRVSNKTIEIEEEDDMSASADLPHLKILSRLWSQVLAIPEEEINGSSSFFEMGGDSISAMKLVSEAKMEGLELTVAQIFKARKLRDMAGVVLGSLQSEPTHIEAVPFSAIEVPDIDEFVTKSIVPQLADPSWKVVDVLPARPLQDVAVTGTFRLPRYSARYELFYLDAGVDQDRLFESCQEVVSRNEILRTVFVHVHEKCFNVVLEDMKVDIDTYEIEDQIEPFAKQLCELDIQRKIPLGSPFVKFLFVKNDEGKSALMLKISHAQYDEICLPILLQQVSAIYESRPILETVPFSQFVYHTLKETIPQSVPYWRELLVDSTMTTLPPPTKLVSRTPMSIHKYFDISTRQKDITVATLAPAAWALTLARYLSLRDVTFGEVASGRNTSISTTSNSIVMGPTWQYIPLRVSFLPEWTVHDLLSYIQAQHITSSPHQGMGLTEIVEQCTDWPKSTNWFDSVVHQDVEHVEELEFLGRKARMETFYPHLEPLREWKIQCFPDLKNDRVAIEIVTFEEWRSTAETLLEEIEKCMELLVGDCSAVLFEKSISTTIGVDVDRELEAKVEAFGSLDVSAGEAAN